MGLKMFCNLRMPILMPPIHRYMVSKALTCGCSFHHRKILRLACMDIHTENAKDIAKFFTLYNEILQKETGKKGYHFNPHYFMCDKGSANYCAVWQVYGEDFTNSRVVGCQWHFKKDVNRHSKDVSPDMRGLFISLCHKLCACTITAK